MSEIVKNYRNITDQIRKCHREFSVTSKNPKLIAVSKTFSEQLIKEVIDEGHRVFGENKVQEAFKKWIVLKNIYKDIELHLIGPLQSNKIKMALEVFDVIQTIDREKIVLKIKDLIDSDFKKRTYKFFIQINIGDEKQKNGIQVDDLKGFLEWIKYDVKFKIDGLMCIPPFDQDPSLYFNLLRNLCDQNNLVHASMGMTNDYKKAIQFGATYIRIGSGIFGDRS